MPEVPLECLRGTLVWLLTVYGTLFVRVEEARRNHTAAAEEVSRLELALEVARERLGETETALEIAQENVAEVARRIEQLQWIVDGPEEQGS